MGVVVSVLWLVLGVRIDFRRSSEVEDERRGVGRRRKRIEYKEGKDSW